MLGMGLRVALVVLIRGTPWNTRGSFIKVGSSFAGTGPQLATEEFEWDLRDRILTSGHYRPIVPWNLSLWWRSRC